MRLAGEVGVDLSEELLGDSIPPVPAPPNFTAVVFIESGYVPPRTEAQLSIPILKSEADEHREDLGDLAGRRALLRCRGEWIEPPTAEVAYWLEIALPAYGPDPYLPPSTEISAFGETAAGFQAADIASCAREALEREMPAIALRSALRALIKYAAHHQAEKEGGEALGILVNLFGAATEAAETRTWLSLPHRIDVAVLDLPRPVGAVALTVRDSAGRKRSMGVPLVQSSPGFGFGSCRIWN